MEKRKFGLLGVSGATQKVIAVEDHTLLWRDAWFLQCHYVMSMPSFANLPLLMRSVVLTCAGFVEVLLPDLVGILISFMYTWQCGVYSHSDELKALAVLAYSDCPKV